jgi:hypothetical protein
METAFLPKPSENSYALKNSMLNKSFSEKKRIQLTHGSNHAACILIRKEAKIVES